MINELQRHPFARPLIVWILGIILEVNYNIHLYAYCSLFIILGILIIEYVTSRSKEDHPTYNSGAWWGIIFLSLLLISSTSKTYQSLNIENRNIIVENLRTYSSEKQKELALKFDKLNVSNDEKAILSTLTLGEKSSLNYKLRKKFSTIGVAHLLAVSGFHVGIISFFWLSFFHFLPRGKAINRIKFISLILVIWIYAFITGLAAATIRASIMITLYCIAQIIRRKPDNYNILFSSAFFMLLYDPLYLYDVGFQLSYSAVFSILYFMPKFKHWFPIRNPLFAWPWNCMLISISAQIGTFGLVLFYFREISTLFIVTAIPFTIVTSLLIPLSFFWLFIPEVTIISPCLQSIISTLSNSMMLLLEYFNKFSFATITIEIERYVCVIIYVSLAFIGVILTKRLNKRFPYSQS